MPNNYPIELNPSHYALIKTGEINWYDFLLPHENNSEVETISDLPTNIAQRFKDVAVGDTLEFICRQKDIERLPESQRVKYGEHIFREIYRIDIQSCRPAKGVEGKNKVLRLKIISKISQ